MNLKEELQKFKASLLKKDEVANYSLDKKVDDYINWYTKNMVEGKYTDIGEYLEPRRMKDFIEKMAVWYELRYPEFEVNRLYPCCGNENKTSKEVFFTYNDSIKKVSEVVDDKYSFDSAIDLLEWDDFFAFKPFMNSLSGEERWLLNRPRYQDLVYVNPDDCYCGGHLHLTAKGHVTESEDMEHIPNWGAYLFDPFKDMHIKTVVEFMKQRKMKLPSNNELESAIKNFETRTTMKERLLDCVMYRIIDRGGNRIGPRRAFMFAKEFNRNIDIPLIYGIDYSDPRLRDFILEYIKAGGSNDLECLVGFGARNSEKGKLDTTTIKDILKIKGRYTEEESAYHQRLVNALLNSNDGTSEESNKKLIKDYKNKYLNVNERNSK